MIRLISYDKKELVQMVRRIMACEDDETTMDELISNLEESVPHPAMSDLIYWPPNDEELSAEEIVDIALSYKWEEHQKRCYSKTMKILIERCDIPKKIDMAVENILPKDFKASVSSVTCIHDMKDVNLETQKNKINLGNLFSDFKEQLLFVEQLERWLKEKYPNKVFCSYFIHQQDMSIFCFHVEYPNMHWISDRKVKMSKDCIRKNTF